MKSLAKGVYDPKAFFLHAASLGQAFAHCPRFPAAASRRSGGRVSVPLWLAILSDQLPVFGLVGRYPANYLIGRKPVFQRLAAFLSHPAAGHRMRYYTAFRRLIPHWKVGCLRVIQPFATDPPLAGRTRSTCMHKARRQRSS